MLRYLTFRLAALIGIVFVISVFCFILIHLAPGNPVQSLLGFGDTPKNRAILYKQFGLNKPLIEQYLTWVGNLFHGNLGWAPSVGYLTPRIESEFRIDLELVVYSQAISFLVAVPLSVYSARRPNGPLDQSTGIATFAIYSLPGYVLVVWSLLILTQHFHVFPGPGANPFPTGIPWYQELRENLYVLCLPSLILAAGSIALFVRFLRNDMVVTLQEDFITVARSKGLSRRRILWRHALRPSMAGMLATLGNNVALLLTSLFVIELKFNLNGVGADLINAIFSSQYLLVQGIAFVACVTVVVVNFAVDIITTALDPRIARG